MVGLARDVRNRIRYRMRPIYTVSNGFQGRKGTYSWKDMTSAPRIAGGALHVSSIEQDSKELTFQPS